MNETKSEDKKPFLGFFPITYNLAETGRAVMIAKRYKELGGKAIFFSHGGEYKDLPKDHGFEVVKVKPFFTNDSVKKIISINRGEQKGFPYPTLVLREFVQNEIEAYKKTGIEMIISTQSPSCIISARAAHIPLITVTTGLGTFRISYPEKFENVFSRLLPQKVKIKILNLFYTKGKKFLEPFNEIAKEYNIKPFKYTSELANGDVTLVTNFLEFINIFPNQQRYPSEDYIGIILLDELFSSNLPTEKANTINKEIQNHLESNEHSILLSMGSSGDKKLFLKILQTLNNTSYRVIAVYTNILKDNELPKLNKNIMLKKYVPSIGDLHKKADISIIHGGQGTVYSCAYSGKPIIGFPMQAEQHLNLEKMVGHGVGLMLSKKYFTQISLLEAVNEIFNNYSRFLKNAQNLTQKLPKPEGDKNAVKRILEISQKLG
jgi:spore coat polysaccharide biosynthesis predicted glycosyltransferase SpsG